MKHLTFTLAAVGTTLIGLTAFAAQPDTVTGIKLYDLNANGKIERAVISVDNSDHKTWAAHGTAGFKVWYGTNQLNPTDAFVTSVAGADPAQIELMWNEQDTNLPVDTSAANFQIQYDPQAVGVGTDNGSASLPVIPKDNSVSWNTEIDAASPILLNSAPLPSSLNVPRRQPIILTFSEPIKASSAVFTTSPEFSGWTTDISADRKVITQTPNNFGNSRTVMFTVSAATDDASNPLAQGTYPNPFTFRTASTDGAPQHTDPTLFLSNPVSSTSLTIGKPNFISWYTNQTDIVSVRISTSRDGSNYTPLFTTTVTNQTYPWFPTGPAGILFMKIEGLNAGGTAISNAVVGPLTLSSSNPLDTFAVLANPMVSMIDTSAQISFALNRPATTVSVTCNNAPVSSSFVTSNYRPVSVVVSLSNLQKNTTYACTASLTDVSGSVLNVSVPTLNGTPITDTVAPAIVQGPAVDSFDAAAKTARLTWTTDEPSTFVVNYGPLLNYGGQATDTVLSTTHTVTLTNLTPGAMHQLRITSVDASGNAAATSDYYFIFLKNGDRVKSKTSSAVYWYLNGKRYVFPNETIYASWFADFYNILTIPSAQLASLPIGGNIEMHSGTWLMKITSDPKVYAVEPDGTLRWIATEARAVQMFGPNWAKHVRDIDVSLFGDYHIGKALSDDEFPESYAATTADGSVWVVSAKNVTRQQITKSGLEANHYVAASTNISALFNPVAENTQAWSRLTVGQSITTHQDALNVVHVSADGTQVIAP